MSDRELLPLEALKFDWSGADSRFGLPRAVVNGRPVQVFAVPRSFAPEWDLERTEFRFGAELALCALAWLRRCYLAEDGDGAHADATIHEDYSDLPQVVQALLRKDLGNVEWATLWAIERSLVHAATTTGSAPYRTLHAEDLDALTREESERRLFVILRGEMTLQVGFVNTSQFDDANGGAAC